MKHSEWTWCLLEHRELVKRPTQEEEEDDDERVQPQRDERRAGTPGGMQWQVK